MRDYPEAFARKVDPDAGVCLEGWLIGDARTEEEKAARPAEMDAEDRTMYIGKFPVKEEVRV